MTENWYCYKLRVRYAETDQMKVVYHANYLPWLELGRTDLLRKKGVSYKELESEGILVPVLGLEISYESPAFYDDHIAIFTRIQQFGLLRMSFEYEVRRCDSEHSLSAENVSGEDVTACGPLLARAITHHAWLNKEWKPIRIHREAPQIYARLTSEA